MHPINCAQSHAPEIQAIFNDAILHTTALWEYEPRSLEIVRAYIEKKDAARLPLFGFIDNDGRLAAFASYGSFRPFAAFQYTAEHSIYVAREYRRQGLGWRLLQRLIKSARTDKFHVLIGAIAAENTASLALHERAGFEHCGIVKQAGYKFDRWIDLRLMQLIIGDHASVSGRPLSEGKSPSPS